MGTSTSTSASPGAVIIGAQASVTTNPFKFGRNYYLSVQPNTGAESIIIQLPFTIEFDIQRNNLLSLNQMKLSIYNLGVITRNLLLKDFTDFSNTNQKTARAVFLQAGYGSSAPQLPTIFYGTIFQCYSRRDGVDYITEITAMSGGYKPPNCFYNGPPFPPGTTIKVAIGALMNNFAAKTGYNAGYIGDFPGAFSRYYVPSKSIVDELNELTGGGVFIDDKTINCLPSGGSLPSNTEPPVISSATGLLETPSREQQIMTIPVLFSPEIQPGQLVNLQSVTIEQSVTSPYFNNFSGICRVRSVHHKGTISASVCGDLTTEITVSLGEK